MKEIRLDKFAESIVQKKLIVYHAVIRQHGEVVGTFDWRDNRRDNIHSCSKSFVSMAIGIGIDEGVISLDDKPAEIFPDKLPKNASSNLFEITVRDMIMMATGHDYFILQGYSGKADVPGRNDLEETDWIKYAFQFDVPHKPGTLWKYNNFGPYLVSCIITHRTGERLVDYMKPRFFTPLGIRYPQWFEDPQGRTLGCGGLHLSCEELSRASMVFLDGCYEGRRIVNASYIREATSKLIDNTVIDTSADKGKDSSAGYGYFFWRHANDNAYRAAGWAGQYAIQFPEQNATVTITSHDFEGQKIFDSVWETVLPQLKEYA